MTIIKKKISDIKPYARNARINDDAVKYVMNSIKSFGYRVPIVIDGNDEIIAGHTRYKALKKLGYKDVDCVVASDLTPEQVKAFRLADNKVAEKSEWDYSLLDSEISEIEFFDMEDFGFDFVDEESEPKEKHNERERTVNGYNLQILDLKSVKGKWDIPEIAKTNHIPSNLIGFNYCKSSTEYNAGVHFFIDDYQFERVWNNPEEYANLLASFDCVLTPDFSLYRDMPLCMQLWNVYRSRLMGHYWQSLGMNVIPTVSWCDERSYEFCFDGLPERSILAISSVGVLRRDESRKLYVNGVKEMIKRCKPKKLIVYGQEMKDYDYEGVDCIRFTNSVTERMSLKKEK